MSQSDFVPVDDVPRELSDEVIFSAKSAYKLKEKVKRASNIAVFRVFWGFLRFISLLRCESMSVRK